MIASKSPSDKRRADDAADAAAAAAAGAAEESSPPAPPASASASAAGGGTSRTTSTATTATTATTSTTSTAKSAVSSITFDEAALRKSEASGSTSTGNGQSGNGRQPPSRPYASFASDTSFVIGHNDDNDEEGSTGPTKKETSKKDKPLERIRQHFASHQTNDARSDSVGSEFQLQPTAVAGAPSAAAVGATGRPPRSNSATAATNTNKSSTMVSSNLLDPLRRHFASHSQEPSNTPHLHALPTTKPATQTSLSSLTTLIASKRLSLRPVELNFLEDVCQYGGEDEVLCAMQRLEDDSLFFDCAEGGVGEGEEGKDTEEKKLDGTTLDDDDDDIEGDDAEEEKEEEEVEVEEYTPANKALYTELTAGKVDSQEVEVEQQMSRQWKEKCSILADDDDEVNTNADANGNDATATSTDHTALASKPLQLTNAEDNAAAMMKKAKARKMWTKLGSAARMAALANRRAQHRTARTTSTGTSSLPSQDTNASGGIVDAVPGQGIGINDSQTSTSTSNIASIWRAHESGLSVTSLSSERRIDQKRRSMLQLAGVPTVGSSTILTAPPLPTTMRRSANGGGGGGGGTNSRRAAYRNAVGGDSFLSVGSLGDVLVDTSGDLIDPTTHNAEEEDKVFRRQDEDAIFRSDGEAKADDNDKLEDSDDELFEDEIEKDKSGLNTSTASAPVPESPGKIARPAGFGASDSEGGGMNRRSISVGSVRSVKFAGGHTLHEFSEDDMQVNKIEIPADRPPPSRLPGRPPTILRRSSSLNRLPPSTRRQVAAEMSRARLLSADVTPVSSPSASSIPSIRHAHPIRSDSAMSLGSVASATPSLNLHRANPLRSDSFISVGSAISAAPSLNLHRANPIRSNSVLSMSSAAPSLNLHRANPIRSQSFLSEIGDVGLQRNTSVAESVLTFDESPITSPRASSMSADEPEDEAVTAAKAAAAAAATKNSRPVMMRMASKNNYDGEGFEIADMVEVSPSSPAKKAMLQLDSIDNARKYRSLLSEASDSMLTVDRSFKAMPIDDFVRSSMFRRTLSDDGLYGDNDSNGDLFDFANENDDWDLESEPEIQDAWNVLQDEYAVGYSSIPFFILGTSADDADCHPHVLSPPLMESLQPFSPYACSEDNFYLKFSLVRDGASLHTLLQNVRGAKHTIVAIETVEGEVFGAFCSSAWRKNWIYFGSGEAFLWRMRRGRDTHCPSIIDQAQMESELDVFPWSGTNNFVQLCTSNKIAIGGGTNDDTKADSGDKGGDANMDLAEGDQKTSWDMEDSPPFGFGLAVEDDLLHGMSSPCLTFNSPPLSKKHADGSPFEILNLEIWTLTPCNTVEEAEKLELSRLFLEDHRATSM